MSDIFERILYLVEKEADGKAEKFGEMIGFSGQAVRYVSNLRRNNPNFNMLVAILETFVWINPEWLITGKGSMKKENDDDPGDDGSKKTKTTSTMEDRLLTIIESQQRTIENLSKKGGGIAEDALTAHAKKTS